MHRALRTLFAVAFDLDRLEVRGTPVPVLEGVGDGGFGSAQIDFSGTLIPYASRRVSGQQVSSLIALQYIPQPNPSAKLVLADLLGIHYFSKGKGLADPDLDQCSWRQVRGDEQADPIL